MYTRNVPLPLCRFLNKPLTGSTQLAGGWLTDIYVFATLIALYLRAARQACFTGSFRAPLPTADCRFGLEIEWPAVNHEVVGSRLDHRDYSYFLPFKVPSTACVAYSVKQDLLQSFSTYSFNTNNFNNFSSVYATRSPIEWTHILEQRARANRHSA